MLSPLAIELDLLCLNCGYNLRAIPLDSRCPECGVPVRQSLAARPFGDANRRVLNRVTLGFVLALFSSPLAGLMVLIAVDGYRWPALVCLFPGGDKGWLMHYAFLESRYVPEWLTGVGLFSLALHLVSVWLLTTYAPRIPGVMMATNSYRALAVISIVSLVIARTGLLGMASFVFVLIPVICDLAQMIFFIRCAASIARAGTFDDLDRSLSRAQDLLLLSALLICPAFCGACAVDSGSIIRFTMAMICAVPAYLACVSVVRLTVRVHQARPMFDGDN